MCVCECVCVCVCMCMLAQSVSVWRTQHSSHWTRGSDHHPYTFCVCVLKERKGGIVTFDISKHIVCAEWRPPKLRAAFEDIMPKSGVSVAAYFASLLPDP